MTAVQYESSHKSGTVTNKRISNYVKASGFSHENPYLRFIRKGLCIFQGQYLQGF